MKNRKWQRILSWILTMTMLLGTFESNILAVNAMDDEAVEADAEIDEEEVVEADGDVEEPEDVSGTYAENGLTIKGEYAASGLSGTNDSFAMTTTYGNAFASDAKLTAEGADVTWKVYKNDTTFTEATFPAGVQGTADGNIFTISGTPTELCNDETYAIYAISANGVSANVVASITVDKVNVAVNAPSNAVEITVPSSDTWDKIKMGYTVDAAAEATSTNVVPKTFTFSNGSGQDLTGLTVKLEGDDENFELVGGGTDLTLAKNANLSFTVQPKTGLKVWNRNDKTPWVYTTKVSVSSDHITWGSSTSTPPLEKLEYTLTLNLYHDMELSATKAGEAFTGDTITVSAGNAMPALVVTATGGNNSIAWEDGMVLPQGVTANKNGNVLTISGTPAISSNIVDPYTFTVSANDDAASVVSHNKVSKNYTIAVTKADVSLKVDGADKMNVVKTAAAGYYQADVALKITAYNNGESAVKVTANIGGDSDSFSFYPDNKTTKTVEIAAGKSTDIVVYPNLNVADKTAEITFTGDAIVLSPVTFRFITADDVLLITEPADGKLPAATVGEAYSYTLGSDGTVSANARKWTVSENSDFGDTTSAADLENKYGLTLSDNGVLSGTPKKVTVEEGIDILVAVSGNNAISMNVVNLKIVSTNSAIVVSANGVVLSGATASENVVDLGTVNTKLTDASVSNNTAKIWIKNTSDVDLGNIAFSVVKTEKLGADGKYAGDYSNIFAGSGTLTFNGNAKSYAELSVSPNVATIGAAGFTPDNAGTYRALCKFNTNTNIVAKEFYVTLTIKNSVEIKDVAADKLKFKVNEAVAVGTVSFDAVSKNATDVKLTDVTFSWTASSNSMLPEGLTLSANGILYGTPTQAGTFNVSVNVVDNSNQETATKEFTITVTGSTEIDFGGLADYTFDGVIAGESITQNPLEVAVYNGGTVDVTNAKISIKDKEGYTGSAAQFRLSTDTIAKINKNGGFEKFTIVPVDSSAVGTFKATVTVSGNIFASKSFDVAFTRAPKLTITQVPTGDAEVGQEFKYTVSAASVSYDGVPQIITWTITQVSENGAVLTGPTPLATNDFYNGTKIYGEAGTYNYVLSANIAEYNTPTVNVSENKAEARFSINVSKSASVNVTSAEGGNVNGYSVGKSTPASPSSNITAYTFASRAAGYDDTNKETVLIEVTNNSAIDLSVSGNSSNTGYFEVTEKSLQTVTSGHTGYFHVSPKTGLAAGTYTADFVVNGPEVADKVVTLSFTVEEARDSVEVSSNNVVIAEEGLTLKATKKGATAQETTINYKNTGNVDIKVAGIKEVLDATGTEIDINDNSKFKLLISSGANPTLKPEDTASFTIKPVKTEVGEYETFVKITYSVGSTLKDPVVFKVKYTIYKDSVSVNVTPSANSVSINGTASVSENYTSAYSVGFVVTNGEAGVTGDTTETLYNLRVALSGTNADAFVLSGNYVSATNTAFGAETVAKGSAYNFNIAAKSGLAYGVYKANVEISASNMATISKEIVFTVTGKTVNYATDATSAGVSDNVAVNAKRIYNTLQAMSESSNTVVVRDTEATNIQFTVSNDIIVSFNTANKDSITESYAVLKAPHTITDPSYTISRNNTTDNAARDYANQVVYFDFITFNLFDIVTFDAMEGKFAANGSDIISVNVANGGKIAEFPSVSKNNASLKGWFDVKNNEITTATTISQDLVVNAAWAPHTYPASVSGDVAGQVEWTWGSVSNDYAGTYVTIYCTESDCPNKAASAVKLDATIEKKGVVSSCTTGASYEYKATATYGDNTYTDTKTVKTEGGLGHQWKFDLNTVVWSSDYKLCTISKNCVAKYHDKDRDREATVSVSTSNISFNGVEATCTTSGNGVYVATFTSADDPAISENIVVSINAAEVAPLGHKWVVKSVTSDGSYETAPTTASLNIACENDADHTATVSATSITLVSENELQKTYKYVGAAPDDQAVEGEETFYSHKEHEWNVVFTWKTISTNKVNTEVTAEATCKNGGEKVELPVTLEDKTIGSKIEYTATAIDPNGKKWTSKKNIDTKSGESKDGPAGQPLVEGGDIVIIGLNEDGYPFSNKKAITPAFTVMDGDVVLALSKDYTVKYKNNKAVTDAAIIEVTGKGNYQGKSTSATFKIYDPVVKAKEDGVELIEGTVKKIDKIAAVTYNGTAQYPEQIVVTMKDKSTVTMKHEGDGVYVNASEAADAKQLVVTVTNNVKKGSAIVAVAAADGTVKTATFKINAADISTATVADDMEATFAVKGTRPDHISVIWKNGDDEEVELVEGQDFTVSLKDNKAVGTGKLIIKGKGNFAKKNESGSFKINALEVTEIAGVAAYEGVKAKAVKVTILDGQGVALPAKALNVVVKNEEGTAVDPKTKLAAGKYTVVVTSKNANVTIDEAGIEKDVTVGANIGKAKIDAKKLTVTYTGEPIELTDEQLASVIVTLKVGKEKKTLVAGEDYKVVGYTNNVKKGNMIVTIEGTGEETERGIFSGTKTFKVKIVAKNLDAKSE